MVKLLVTHMTTGTQSWHQTSVLVLCHITNTRDCKDVCSLFSNNCCWSGASITNMHAYEMQLEHACLSVSGIINYFDLPKKLL